MGPGRSITRAVLTVALVAVLIANPMGMAAVERSSPVGDAAAQDGTQPNSCSTVLNFLVPVTALDCQLDRITSAEIAESWISIHSQATSMYATSVTYRDTFYNAMLASNDTAFLQGEMAAVESFVANKTKQESQVNAVENVTSYVTVRQKNLISAWNTRIASLQNLYVRDQNVSGQQFDQFFSETAENGDTGYYLTGSHIHGFYTENATLADGTQMEVRGVIIDVAGSTPSGGSYAYGDLDNPRFDLLTGQKAQFQSVGGSNWETKLDSIYSLSPPETSYTGDHAVKPAAWAELWTRTEELNSSAVTEMKTFVEATWGEYQHNNVTAQDLLSRLNLMENYQVNVGDNATFNDVVAALAASGFSTPDSSTGWMNMTYERGPNQTVTTEGMLLSSNSPENETWQIGKQYHSDNVSGLQMVATLDGRQHTINGTFTMHSVYDRNGTEQNVTEVTSPDQNYRVSNVSELNDQIVLLGETITELENRLATDGGGGGIDIGWQWSGWPDWIPDIPVTGIIAGLAVVLILAVLSFIKP